MPQALPPPPADIDARIQAAIQGTLPGAFVHVDPLPTYRRVVKVVSHELDGRSETDKQDTVWDALRNRLDADSQYVSYVVTYGTDEL